MQEIALKILVVEDNDGLREATTAFLSGRGHLVRSVSMAEEIDDLAGGFVPDVYVIDVGLPGEDGLSLTRRLRATHPNAGIVIATARAQIGEKVDGYDSGADLYLTKPVHPQELLAGVVALSKRLQAQPVNAHAVQFDLTRHRLSGASGQVDLTAAESVLLAALARAPGQTLERWQIVDISKASGESPTAATVEMRISRLRKKLAVVGAEAPCIKALHKIGYSLCCRVVLV